MSAYLTAGFFCPGSGAIHENAEEPRVDEGACQSDEGLVMCGNELRERTFVASADLGDELLFRAGHPP
ncbi:hypothetical protein BH09MYX1_BH09MYX1_22690 [soil metagenome]